MSFPAYEEYKDSGVGWLGFIPVHWQLAASRYAFENLDFKRISLFVVLATSKLRPMAKRFVLGTPHELGFDAGDERLKNRFVSSVGGSINGFCNQAPLTRYSEWRPMISSTSVESGATCRVPTTQRQSLARVGCTVHEPNHDHAVSDIVRK